MGLHITKPRATVEVSAISIAGEVRAKPKGSDEDSVECEGEWSCSSRSSSNTSSQLSTSPSLSNAYITRRRSSLRASARSSSLSIEDTLFDGGQTTLLSSSVGSEFSILTHPLEEGMSDLFAKDGDNDQNNNTYTSNTQLDQIIQPVQKSDPFLNLGKLVGLFKEIRDTTVKNHTFHIPATPKRLSIEVPLETFNNGFNENGFIFDEILNFEPNIMTLTLNGKSKRMREERINPNYLKHYSIIQSMQNNYALNISEQELDIFDQFLIDYYHMVTNEINDPFNFQKELLNRLSNCWKWKNKLNNDLALDYLIELKFMSLARHKLWATMTLTPRKDELPSINSICDDIIPNKPLNIIKNFDSPWMSIKDIPNKKKLTGFGINGNRYTQYVSKGSKSKRYTSSQFAN